MGSDVSAAKMVRPPDSMLSSRAKRDQKMAMGMIHAVTGGTRDLWKYRNRFAMRPQRHKDVLGGPPVMVPACSAFLSTKIEDRKSVSRFEY